MSNLKQVTVEQFEKLCMSRSRTLTRNAAVYAQLRGVSIVTSIVKKFFHTTYYHYNSVENVINNGWISAPKNAQYNGQRMGYTSKQLSDLLKNENDLEPIFEGKSQMINKYLRAVRSFEGSKKIKNSLAKRIFEKLVLTRGSKNTEAVLSEINKSLKPFFKYLNSGPDPDKQVQIFDQIFETCRVNTALKNKMLKEGSAVKQVSLKKLNEEVCTYFSDHFGEEKYIEKNYEEILKKILDKSLISFIEKKGNL